MNRLLCLLLLLPAALVVGLYMAWTMLRPRKPAPAGRVRSCRGTGG